MKLNRWHTRSTCAHMHVPYPAFSIPSMSAVARLPIPVLPCLLEQWILVFLGITVPQGYWSYVHHLPPCAYWISISEGGVWQSALLARNTVISEFEKHYSSGIVVIVETLFYQPVDIPCTYYSVPNPHLPRAQSLNPMPICLQFPLPTLVPAPTSPGQKLLLLLSLPSLDSNPHFPSKSSLADLHSSNPTEHLHQLLWQHLTLSICNHLSAFIREIRSLNMGMVPHSCCFPKAQHSAGEAFDAT